MTLDPIADLTPHRYTVDEAAGIRIAFGFALDCDVLRMTAYLSLLPAPALNELLISLELMRPVVRSLIAKAQPAWKEAAEEAVAHNLADVSENGPRLAWGRKTAAVAIDRRRKYVLETGLGAMGVGTMWIRYDDEAAEWADLPEEDSTGQFGAEPVVLPRRVPGVALPVPCGRCGHPDARHAWAPGHRAACLDCPGAFCQPRVLSAPAAATVRPPEPPPEPKAEVGRLDYFVDRYGLGWQNSIHSPDWQAANSKSRSWEALWEEAGPLVRLIPDPAIEVMLTPEQVAESMARVHVHAKPHASPGCACGENEAGWYFVDPICRQFRARGGHGVADAPLGSPHGAPDWRADPDDVTDPCVACGGEGCQFCNGTGNDPHRAEVDHNAFMHSYTAGCSCGWAGQEEKSLMSAMAHHAEHTARAVLIDAEDVIE